MLAIAKQYFGKLSIYTICITGFPLYNRRWYYTENKNLIVVLRFTIYHINLSDISINFTVLTVVATIGNEVICAVKFNAVQFKFSAALAKLTTNSVTSVKN